MKASKEQAATHTFRLVLAAGWLLSLCGVLFAGDRTQFTLLLACYSLCYICYALLLLQKKTLPLGYIFLFGTVGRVVALVACPFLSEDIYRYLWDGWLIHEGISPMLAPPSELLDDLGHLPPFQDLYPKLNSPHYYSIYPPLSQVFFWLSTFFGFSGALWALKSVFFLAELSGLLLLFRLRKQEKITTGMFTAYALQPLLLVELLGQGHTEALLLPLLVLLYGYLMKEQSKKALVMLAFAVWVKLWPLMALPLFLQRKKILSSLLFSGVVFLVILAGFYPLFIGASLQGFLSSFSLYFKTFEFNASFYYLTRELGIWYYGWNPIHHLGPGLQVITVVVLLRGMWLLWKEWSGVLLWQIFTLAYASYLFLATSVHPWYVLPLVLMGLLSGYVFPLVWAFTVFLSYHAYQTIGRVEEQTFWLWAEYLSVLAMCSYELVKGGLWKPQVKGN